MKKLVIASLFVASIGSVAALAEELSGYISDSHCGAKHHEVSEANTKCGTHTAGFECNFRRNCGFNHRRLGWLRAV